MIAHLCGVEQASFEQVKLGPPIHLPFGQLQPGHLPFDLSV
jgi:hypothetical protein